MKVKKVLSLGLLSLGIMFPVACNVKEENTQTSVESTGTLVSTSDSVVSTDGNSVSSESASKSTSVASSNTNTAASSAASSTAKSSAASSTAKSSAASSSAKSTAAGSTSGSTATTTTTTTTKTATSTATPIIINNNEEAVQFISAGGDQEEVYATFKPVKDATGYDAYVSSDGTKWTKLDDPLIRLYKDSSNDYYYRVDAVGLSAGIYQIKVNPIIGAEESTTKGNTVTELEAVAYERTGFTFSTISDLKGAAPGAYNLDGTLKSNAQVIYLTEANKNTVTATIGGTSCTGIAAITQQFKNATAPLCVRIIGEVNYSGTVCDDLSSWYAMGVKGDISKGKGTVGITFEGIGNDAVMYGGGIGFNKITSAEVRNIGFINWGSADSDSDAVSLQGSTNVWVHDNDIFYGHQWSGDQVKGDGSCDLKDDSKYVTVSYNHFWDSGKMSLCGMKSETGDNYISYHHNWFDHSDSRHPRIRTMSVHVYNNYYDGNSKYGVGVTYGGNAFWKVIISELASTQCYPQCRVQMH